MKITKSQLKQIIKEELEGALKEGYRGPAYRYSRKGSSEAALKRKQRKESSEMKEKGRADALAGRPKDESITHLAYSRAYDETAGSQTDINKDGTTDAQDVLAVAQDAADQDQMELSLNEVKITKQGFFEGQSNIEWEIFDNGKICFETHHEEDYSPTSLCVPLDELRQIVASTRETRPDRNAYMWDKTAEAFPEEYEGAKNPFRK
jgi:hypothetical protein